ncbi:MAG: tRNA lysidine(34) synthetase TilS [Verrucomicrobia bacterium]|nr:MAG: tRNA lysidine(34) synthetase TilS [Verrucomicrobiota bacterium]
MNVERSTSSTVALNITPDFICHFPTTRRYLIGVSGGRDSVALLHLLVDVGYHKLVVCHLNHQLRGRSSDADARFVQKLVELHNQRLVGQALHLPARWAGKRSARPTKVKTHIDFELGTVNVREIAKKKKMSIETAAREARYKFFAETARRRKCKTIFLAHHADDLVETFLINLFRGSGSAGLAGMREVFLRRIDDVDLTIGRPLLGAWRNEINKYVRTHRLKFREDASNKNLTPLRNRVRQRIIPYIEKQLGRKIRMSVWRAARIAADEENWIDTQLRVPPNRDGHLNVRELRPLSVALQRRTILKWLRAQNVSDIGFDAIERVRSLLDPAAHIAKVNLAQDRHVRRRTGRIFVE